MDTENQQGEYRTIYRCLSLYSTRFSFSCIRVMLVVVLGSRSVRVGVIQYIPPRFRGVNWCVLFPTVHVLPQQVIVHFGCFQWLPDLATGSCDVTSCSRVLDDIIRGPDHNLLKVISELSK